MVIKYLLLIATLLNFSNVNAQYIVRQSIGNHSLVIGDGSTKIIGTNTILTPLDSFKNRNFYHQNRPFVFPLKVGLEENKNQNKLKVSVYPNPAKDKLFIRTELKDLNYEIYNQQGKLCFTSNSNEINLTDFTSGLYLLKISNLQFLNSTIKLIISK